jgi:hypothetical protein
MITKLNPAKTIDGIDAEDYFGGVIGPMAMSILEKCLYKFLQTNGEGMTGPELKMVQFALERSYGAATRQVNHVKVSDQQIAVENLEGIDPEILRKIASSNAPRDDRSVN